MKKPWLEETMEIIEDLKKEDEPQDIQIFDQTITVHPGVFSPKYFADVLFFAEVIPSLVDKASFCEVGVGTGVVSLFVALNGAREIVGTDISYEAIENTRENFKRHKQEIDLYQGDVLSTVPKDLKFDYIFWNHPFNKVEFEVKDNLLKTVLDQNFIGLETYFSTAGDYLKDNGTLILGSGELADQTEVLELAGKYGWSLQRTHKRGSKVRVGGDRPMELYIHEFSKR